MTSVSGVSSWSEEERSLWRLCGELLLFGARNKEGSAATMPAPSQRLLLNVLVPSSLSPRVFLEDSWRISPMAQRETFQCFGREWVCPIRMRLCSGGGQLSAAAAVTGYSGLSLNDGSPPQCWIAARRERRLRSEKQRGEPRERDSTLVCTASNQSLVLSVVCARPTALRNTPAIVVNGPTCLYRAQPCMRARITEGRTSVAQLVRASCTRAGRQKD